MAKKSSLFKVMTTILTATALTLSVATGIVIGKAFQRYNKMSQKGDDYVPKSIDKIEKTGTYGLVDEYTIYYTDGTTSKFIVTNGAGGERGIQGYPGADGHTPEIIVGTNGNWFVDGVDSGVPARGLNGEDGEDGRGIESIEKTDSTGLIDTYTITYTDGTTSTFIVTNGENGPQGFQGIPGNDGHVPTIEIGSNGNWFIDGVDSGVPARGQTGNDGRSIVSIEKTATNGLIDTYTITYSDDTTSTFVVVNGENGERGLQGLPGEDGEAPVITIGSNGNWFINGTDTGVSATGPQGEAGEKGNSVITGTGTPLSSLGRDGDTYIDLDSWNLYVKEDGAWVVKGNIRGAAGNAGSNGTNGTSVLVGNTDPLPTLGQDGDSYINLLTWDLYVKENGNWVNKGNIKGEQGAAGSTGSNGSSLLTGNGAPSNTDGQNGDTYIDYSTYNIYVKNEGTWTVSGNIKGEAGISIVKIEKTGSTGNVDTYTITYSDNSTSTFTVTNGINGHTPVITIGENGNWFVDGVDTGIKATGPAGANGSNGADGKGIASIDLTSSSGLVDTYTVTFTDGTTFTYTVTNGADGKDGTSVRTGNGVPNNALGEDGDSYINLDNWDYYVKEEGAWVRKGNIQGGTGATGETGENGLDGKSLLTGSGVPLSDLGKEGDSYIDTDTWNVYIKTSTGWGSPTGNIKGESITVVSVVKTNTTGNVDTYTITFSDNSTTTFTVTNGTNGSDGNDGTNGKNVLTGTGAPDAELGVEGDSYIDVENWKLYVKTSTGWEDKGTFKGANGADGTDGSDGEDGVSISNIAYTSSADNVDTYTITFSNGTTTTFTVTNGIDGTNGNTLITGSVNPTNEGVDGDSYLNTTTWEYFVKESGTWVSKGHINGEDGLPGTDGKSLETGIDDPEDDFGKNGDTYINLTTWDLFVKEGDTWVLEGNIHNVADKFTVTFDTDEGSANPDDQEIERGFRVDKPEDPTKEGWIFQGWYGPDGTRWLFDKDVVSSDITLVAHWAKFKVVDGVVVESTATGDVIIPEFFDGQVVTAIGEEVFKNNTEITSVTFPHTVNRIAANAFEGCTGMLSIVLPGNIKNIEQEAFKDCANVAYIYFGEGVENIGERAFAGCNALKALALPNSIQTIGKAAFSGGSKGWTEWINIKTVYSPSAQHIYEFYEDTSDAQNGDIQVDNINGGFSVYRDGVWYYIEQLAYSIDINMGNGAPTDADSAEYNELYLDKDTGIVYVNCVCDLESIITPLLGGSRTGNDQFLGYIFGAETEADNNLYVPASIKSVTYIGDNYIPSYAMHNCKFVEIITIRDNPESIGYAAFADCDNLNTITLPYIGNNSYMNSVSYGHGAPTDSTAGSAYIDEDTSMIYTKNNGVWTPFGSMADDLLQLPLEFIGYGNGEPSGNNYVVYIDRLTNGLYFNPDMDGVWRLMGDLGSNIPNSSHTITGIFSDDGGESIPYSLTKVILTGANGPQRDILPDFAFKNSGYIKEIVLPNNLRVIGDQAFYGLGSLTTINLPNTLTSIGEEAFSRCNHLTSIIIPAGVRRIEARTFDGCYQLASLLLPEGLEFIGEEAFSDCEALKYILLPQSLKRIEAGAFVDCEGLTSIVIPNAVEYIGLGAFENCDALTSITIPFVGCGALTSGESGDQKFGWIFDNNIDSHNMVVIVTGGNGNKKDAIAMSAFQDVTYIDRVVLSNNITKIESSAFKNSSIIEMIVPGSVTSVGAQAFAGCTQLVTYVHEVGAPKTYASNIFISCTRLKTLIIKDTIKTFGTAQFSSCSALEYVYFGYGLETVSRMLFQISNSSIKTVILPESVRTIDENAFTNCTELESITLPQGLVTIGTKAFYNCSSLATIVIPDSVTTIGNNAFERCSALKHVVFGNGLETIGDNAFMTCGSLEAIVFPDSLVSIGVKSFSNTKLKYINFGQGIKVINDWAFVSNFGLENVILPESLEYIGKGAFYLCDNLKSITIPFTGGLSKMGNYLYDNNLSSAPSNDVGSDGDLLVDTANNIIWVKANGEWFNAYKLAKYDGSMPGSIIVGEGGPSSVPLQADAIYIDIYTMAYYETDPDFTTWVQIDFVNLVMYKLGYIFAPENSTRTIAEFNLHCPFSLTDVTVTNGTYLVEEDYYFIPYDAFYKATSIKHVVIEGDVFEIWRGAFKECTFLESVVLTDTIDFIDLEAFKGCAKLESINIPKQCRYLDENVFENCTSLTSIVFPAKLEIIGRFAFKGCINLKYAMFEEGSNLVSIGNEAFIGCSSLENISLGKNIEEIGLRAFKDCIALKTFVIDKDAKLNMYNHVGFLEGCINLEVLQVPYIASDLVAPGMNGSHVFVLNSMPTSATGNDGDFAINLDESTYWCKQNGQWRLIMQNPEFVISDITPTAIYEVDGTVWYNSTNYQMSVYSNGEWVEGVYKYFGYQELGSYFGGNSNSVPVTLKTVIITTSDNGFYNFSNYFKYCQNIETIVLPEDVKRIGESMFEGCYSLKSLVLPENVQFIGEKAFKDCVSLKYVTFGSLIESIGNEAFSGCISLEELAINSPVLYEVGERAFKDCTSLKSLTIDTNRLEEIEYGMNILEGCEKIITIKVPNLGIHDDDLSNSITYYNSDPTTPVEGGQHLNTATGDLFRCIDGSWIKIMNINFLPNTGTITFGSRPDSANEGDIAIRDYAIDVYMNGEWVMINTNYSLVGYFFDYDMRNYVSSSLRNLIISGVEDISYVYSYSFEDTNIQHIELPENTYILGDKAFSHSRVTNFVIPDTVLTIGNQAFEYCTGVKVNAPLNVRYIGEEAFQYCLGVTFVELNNISYIGEYAFSGCANLKYVAINGDNTEIDSFAFYECSTLATVSLTDVKAINDFAFVSCVTLSTVIIDNNSGLLTTVGDDIFQYCYSINTFVYSGTYASWGTDFYSRLRNSDKNRINGLIVHCSDGDYTIGA